MAPAAVATTIPQFTGAAPKEDDRAHLRESSEWNSTMDSSLDFDLLAEYLLDDIGAGGFDFRLVRTKLVHVHVI